MRLKYVPNTQELVKHSFKIEESFSEKLVQYSAYIQEQVGKKISQEEVTASIVKTFLDEDKKFQSWLKARAESTPTEQVSVSGYSA